jgi:phosphoribosylaminoimidazolecarboxamide formyltransferase/IMP cyclohydrolase
MSPELVPLRRALLSVSDKTGLVELARALHARGVEMLSTGGTAQALRDAGLPVRDVAEVTAFPEMLDGRVKTLHPMVHGGLLARRDLPEHRAALEAHGIGTIDLLVVNLYPFEATVAKGADYATCIENIDIGGPAMLRSAAKNHAFVTVLTDVADYAGLLAELDANGGATSLAFRHTAALTAFSRTAAYDAAVSAWMAGALDEATPRRRAFAGTLAQPLRYGENPHQPAAFYRDGATRPGVATARQLQGKELSYNNINDTDAAFELVAEFAPDAGPACAIIKHANPCGVARGGSLADAYRAAYDCDRISAFGGIVALNQTLDAETATAIAEIFTEVVIAPGVEPAARDIFRLKPALRLLTLESLPDPIAAGPRRRG